MTGRRFHVMFLAAFAAVVFSPSVAHAANTSCANADFLFLGERAQYTIASTGSLFFKARVTANRSYSVLAWGPTQDVGQGGVNLGVTLYSDSTCKIGAAGGVQRISAGNYGGKLGPFHFRLREIMQ